MTRKLYFIIGIIAVVLSIGSIIIYHSVIETNTWDNMNCDELTDYQKTDEHNNLTLEKQLDFHKEYNPCMQMKSTEE